MANDFSSKIDILFEDVVTGFDAMNLSAKNVSQYKIGAGTLQQAGQTVYRPVPMLSEVVDGRDMTSSYKDLVEMTVPSTLTDSHLRNVPVQLTGAELNSPHLHKRMVEELQILLSNKLDTLVAGEVADKATLLVSSTGSIDTYLKAAEADALMKEQQCGTGVRCMFLHPRQAIKFASNLAARETMNDAPMSAYQRNTLLPIAGFDTYSVDYAKTIPDSVGSGYLVNGAAQGYTPTAKTSGLPTDNRTGTLIVDTGSGAVNGAFFTIAGVNSVGHINKQDTGQLKTFRLISGAATTTWVISPPMIPANGAAAAQKAHGNCVTTAADNAAITFLNVAAAPASVFFKKDAVELIHADFNTDEFTSHGKKVRKATTDSGLQIVMLSDSSIDTLVAKYRMFVWANANVLAPEMAGCMLENQV